MNGPSAALKRSFDVVASAAGLLLLSPALLGLAAVCTIAQGRPVLFSQPRPGRNAEPFRMLKFRTMRDARDPGTGLPLPDEHRLTAFGRWLRATSLDELPELLNVLKGDMSLVGPRPLLPEYVPLYSQRQARRHEVRPGITGWAQVNGRNAVDWHQRLEMDVWYVEHRSFMLDLRILAMTIGAVLRREGISQDGSATCEPFVGTAGTATGRDGEQG